MTEHDYLMKAIDLGFEAGKGNAHAFEETFRRGVKREAVSHYIWWNTPGAGGRGPIRAACGALVYQTDHANEPTCAQCRAEVARFNALDIADEAPF